MIILNNEYPYFCNRRAQSDAKKIQAEADEMMREIKHDAQKAIDVAKREAKATRESAVARVRVRINSTQLNWNQLKLAKIS